MSDHEKAIQGGRHIMSIEVIIEQDGIEVAEIIYVERRREIARQNRISLEIETIFEE